MSIERTLAQWHKGVRVCHIAHNLSASHYSRLNRLYGIPVVVLSTIVGTSVFATVSQSIDPKIQVVIGLLSIAAAVLASLQTFFRFSELAEKHRSAANCYGRLRHDMEYIQALPKVEGDEFSKIIKELKARWDTIDQDSPTVQQRFHDRALNIVRGGKQSEIGFAEPNFISSTE